MSEEYESMPCPICESLLPITEIFEHAANCRRAIVAQRIASDLQSAQPKFPSRAIRFFEQAHSITNHEYPAATCILDGKLYLGSVSGARNPELLQQHNIRSVLNCAKEIDPLNEAQLEASKLQRYHKLHINDVPKFDIYEHLLEGADFIAQSIAKEPSSGAVLVHCAMGVSRSCSVLLAYLMKYEKMGLLDALLMVQSKRPCIYPNKGFLLRLIELEHELSSDAQSVSSPNLAPIQILELHSNLEMLELERRLK